MPSQHVKSVSLTPELAAWVDEQVASGDFGNASELFREALRDLRDSKERRAAELAEIRSRIRRAIDQLDRGEIAEGTIEEVFARAKNKARARQTW